MNHDTMQTIAAVVVTIMAILGPIYLWTRKVDGKLTQITTVLDIADRMDVKRDKRIEDNTICLTNHCERISVLESEIGQVKKQIC